MKCKKNINLKGLALRIVALGQVVFTLATLGSCKKSNNNIITKDDVNYSDEVTIDNIVENNDVSFSENVEVFENDDDIKDYASYSYLSKHIEDFFPDISKVDEEQKVRIADKYYSFFRDKNLYNENDLLNATNAEVKKIIDYKDKNYECEYVFKSIYDLIDSILENSAKYEKKHQSKNTKNIFNKYKKGLKLDVEEEEIIEAVFSCLFYWDRYATSNKNEDACKLKNLSISVVQEEKDSSVLGRYYREKNLIEIYYKNNKEYLLTVEDLTFSDLIEDVLNHEINHLRQVPCDCRIKKGQKDIVDYSLFANGIMESSAESALYNERFVRPDYFEKYGLLGLSYYDARISEAELMLLSIFNDYSINDYYKAMFDSDISGILKFFCVENKDDIKDFYSILKQEDALNNLNNLAFKILNVHIMTYKEAHECVGSSYRVLLFDNILKELVKYTKNNDDFDLIANILTYDIIKSYILDKYKLGYCDNGEYYFDQEVIDSLKKSDINYIDFLAQYYNVSVDSIKAYEQSLEFTSLAGILSDVLEDYSEDIERYGKYNYRELYFAQKLLERFPKLKIINKVSRYYHFLYLDLDNDNILYTSDKSYTKRKKH